MSQSGPVPSWTLTPNPHSTKDKQRCRRFLAGFGDLERSAGRRAQGADGAAIFARALLAEDEVHAHAVDLDHVAVIQTDGTVNGRAIHRGCFVAGTEKVAVVALVDLRRYRRLEPSLELHGGHGGFADDCELVGEHVLLLIGASTQDDKRGHFQAAGGELHALAHSGGLL